MNTTHINMNEEQCPNNIKIFVERIANEDDDNTVIGRFDLHITVEKDQFITAKIENADLTNEQQRELAQSVEDILVHDASLDNDSYNLIKQPNNNIKIEFNSCW